MYIIKSQWSEGAILIQTDAMDIVEPQGPESGKLSNLPQQTSSSILYTLRAPPRHRIAAAMDIDEPQMFDSTACGLRPDVWKYLTAAKFVIESQ